MRHLVLGILLCLVLAPALQAQGYSGRVIVNRLLDRMTYISSATQSIVERREVMPDWLDTNVDIEIPGSRISLISMMGYCRKWLGRKPTCIVGEVTVHNDQIQVTARIIGMPAKTIVGELEYLDGILQQVAEHLYEHTQPYILASYWRNGSGSTTSADHTERSMEKHLIKHLGLC